jgi:DNA-binding MarR family transcriptional regulator
MSIEIDIKQKSFSNPYNKATVNIMFTTAWLFSKYAKILKPYNITEQQYNVLKILRERYPQSATINFILEGMIDKMSNTSRLVDKLVSKGLVKKATSPYDLRVVDLSLTEKGITLLSELSSIIDNFENTFLELNEKEIGSLNVLLEKIRNRQTSTS